MQTVAPNSIRASFHSPGRSRWSRISARSKIGGIACPGFAFEHEEAGQHPSYVTVDDREGLSGGDGQHGTRSVAAHAGRGECRVQGSGEAATMLVHHMASGFVEVPGSAVITEARPQSEDLVLLGVGEVGSEGKR